MRRSRRSFALAVTVGTILVGAVLSLVLLRRPHEHGDPTWERVRRQGVLRVGMDATYPPFEHQDAGAYMGFDVDLAREIGVRLGLEVEFVNVSFDGLYDALAAGRCDLLISALPYEASRTQDVLYTGGYFNAGQILVAKRHSGIMDWRDLAGKAVAVEMGSQAHQEALRLRDREGLAVTIVARGSSADVMAFLEAGEADAAIADRVTAFGRLAANPELMLCGAPLTDESYVIATRRDSPQLFAAINGTLDALRSEGWLEALARRWLS
ncbi:MAG: substrate-binding periplasmic protein [Anaerolineae bacterium]